MKIKSYVRWYSVDDKIIIIPDSSYSRIIPLSQVFEKAPKRIMIKLIFKNLKHLEQSWYYFKYQLNRDIILYNYKHVLKLFNLRDSY